MTPFELRIVLCRIRLFPTMVSKMKWVWTTLKNFKKFYVMKSIGKNVQFFVHTFKEHFVHGNAQISRDTVLRNVINSNNCQFKESHKSVYGS